VRDSENTGIVIQPGKTLSKVLGLSGPIYSAGEGIHRVPDLSGIFEVSSSSSVFSAQRMKK